MEHPIDYANRFRKETGHAYLAGHDGGLHLSWEFDL